MRNHILDLALFSPNPHSPAHPSHPLSEAWSLVVCMCSTPTKLRSASRDSAYLLCSLQPRENRTRRQGNMSVRTELMEEGWLHANDPWGKRWLLFPCSMVCVKSKTDDIYQWLDSWSRGSKVRYKKWEENTRGRMGLSVTVRRDFTSAFAIQLPGWWIVLEFRTPERLKATNQNHFPCVVERHLIYMCWSD